MNLGYHRGLKTHPVGTAEDKGGMALDCSGGSPITLLF